MRGRGAQEDVFRVRIVLIRGTIAYNTELLDRIRVEFQYLRGIKKQFDDFNIFHQNFKQKCPMALMFCSNVLVRKGSRLKHRQSVRPCYE